MMDLSQATPSGSDRPGSNILFVSPQELFAETQIQLTKINQLMMMYDMKSKEFDLPSYSILLEEGGQSNVFCSNDQYVSLMFNGQRYITNINNTGFSELFKNSAREAFQNSRSFMYLRKLGIVTINVDKILNDPKPLNIPEGVQEEVERLNKIIRDTPYHISCNYGYNFGETTTGISSFSKSACKILLCLFNGPRCVSSVEIIPGQENEHVVWINSFSHPKIEKSGINTMLRAATVLIVPKLNPSFTTIQSWAANPVSAHILLNKLNGYVSDEMLEHNPGLDLITKPIPFKTLEQASALIVSVNVNDPVTIRAAETKFNEVANSQVFLQSGSVSVGGKSRKSKVTKKKHMTRGKKKKGFHRKTKAKRLHA